MGGGGEERHRQRQRLRERGGGGADRQTGQIEEGGEGTERRERK